MQPQASFATLMRTVATVVDAKLGPAVDHALRVEASKEPASGRRQDHAHAIGDRVGAVGGKHCPFVAENATVPAAVDHDHASLV